MRKKSLVFFVALVIFGLTACSPENNVQPSGGKDVVVENHDSPSRDEANSSETPLSRLFKSLGPGSIEKYIIEHGNTLGDLKVDDVLFYSSVDMEKPVTPDLKRGNQITVIALCDGSSGYFVLYKDKEQYANGPCGDFQVVTYRFAPYDVNEKLVFTFKVTGSDNFDVAFFQRNE